MPSNDHLDRLCDQADTALLEGDPEEALERADEALVLSPKSGTALLLKAEALYALEEDEDGDEALKKALRLHPDDPQILLRAAAVTLNAYTDDHEAIEGVLEQLARAEKLAKRSEDPMLACDLARLEGRAHSLLDDLESSAAAFEKARALAGEAADDELLVELAMSWFELLRFDEAKKLLDEVAPREPEHPDVHHYLGLLAERAGDEKTAEQHFARARKLDPEAFPRPVHLSETDFDAAVEAALAKVPERVRSYLANVPVIVEPLPALHDLKGPPALSPLSLGMFRGPVGPGAVAAHTENALPNEILLFQRNLERYASNRDELIEEIEDTLIHEIGHFVGWDEDELYERGLH